MKITKDTEFCISIAVSPGNFGSNIFNSTFKELSLDFIYKPFRVLPDNLSTAILGIRALNIRGCGISMPFKTQVQKYLDKVDSTAKKIGAVNTIVNRNGVLTGYNTDVIGAEKALGLYPIKGKTAHIIGNGGVARAIIVALKNRSCKEIILSGRDEQTAKKVSREFNIRYSPTNTRKGINADLLVNATSVGMFPMVNEMILDEDELKNYKVVMDVVITPLHTRLIETAKKMGMIVIPGFEMALYQAAEQFTLYTGKEAPLSIMMKHMKNFLLENIKPSRI